MKPNYVYVLHSGNRTYTGYTNDPVRRLRQHNGTLKGGAKSTRDRNDWQFLTLTTCATWTPVRAMQVEYKFKHPNGARHVPARYRGPLGRIAALTEIWARVPDEAMHMQVSAQYIDRVRALEVPDRVIISALEHCSSTCENIAVDHQDNAQDAEAADFAVPL